MVVCLSLSTCLSYAKPKKDGYYVIMFIIDGLSPKLFEEMIHDGELPNIKEHIYDKGLIGKNFITVFPSITLTAVSSIMTGVYPAKHKIPAFQWFDRSNFASRSYIGIKVINFEDDLRKNAKPIFDYLPDGECASYGLIIGSKGGINRGLVSSYLNPLDKFDINLDLFYTDILTTLGLKNGVPRYTVFYDWAAILRSYEHGFDSPQAKKTIRYSDKRLGKLIKEYKRRGILDKTYLIVMSDHGLLPSTQNFYADDMLRDKGFSKRRISYNLGDPYVPFSFNPKETYPLIPFSIERVDSLFGIPIYFSGYHIIFSSNSGGVALMYLAKNGGYGEDGKWSRDNWKAEVLYKDLSHYYIGPEKGYFDLENFFKQIEGIDFFIARDNVYIAGEEFRVRVVSKNGMSMITSKGANAKSKVYKYEVLSGEDPLSYKYHSETRKLMDGNFHSGDDWFSASCNYEYPDACVQLSQILETPISGSVIISLKGTWAVNSSVNVKHGAALGDEMRSTFCISGPGISKGTIDHSRTVDVAPSVLYLLEKDFNPADFDGKVMPELKDATIKRGK